MSHRQHQHKREEEEERLLFWLSNSRAADRRKCPIYGSFAYNTDTTTFVSIRTIAVIINNSDTSVWMTCGATVYGAAISGNSLILLAVTIVIIALRIYLFAYINVCVCAPIECGFHKLLLLLVVAVAVTVETSRCHSLRVRATPTATAWSARRRGTFATTLRTSLQEPWSESFSSSSGHHHRVETKQSWH